MSRENEIRIDKRYRNPSNLRSLGWLVGIYVRRQLQIDVVTSLYEEILNV